ncbi:MAG: PilZ domain-containing protein [bacterium]
MKENMMFLLVLGFLVLLLIIAAVLISFTLYKAKCKKRRRWARIRVPNEKMITCRISEPRELSGDTEFLISDINVAGIAFFTNMELEKTNLKLLVKFPFTSFNEASSVWGKVVYCKKVGDSQKYRVGISYVRQKKRGK